MKLPAFLIKDLYEKTLVNIPVNTEQKTKNKVEKNATVTRSEDVTEKPIIKYLGENKKNILIIVEQQAVIYLNEEDLIFLTNILKACKLNLADIALLNFSNQPITYNNLQDELEPVTILLFGLAPKAIKLPFDIPAFQIKKHGDCKIMTAPPLIELNLSTDASKILKSKLWVSLQALFTIK